MRHVYGRHAVEALLEVRPGHVRHLFTAGAPEPSLASLAQRAGVRVESVPREKIETLARSPQHQNVVAEAQDFPYADLEDVVGSGPALVLALDSVQDPRNLGALVRSAECFGTTGVVLPQDRAAEATSVACHAAAGAMERLPVVRVVNLARALERLKERGLWVTGLAGEGTSMLAELDLTGPAVLVVGSEGTGLRRLVRERCDHLARIPMAGRTPSLNASVAGALALCEAAAQRAGRPRFRPGGGA